MENDTLKYYIVVATPRWGSTLLHHCGHAQVGKYLGHFTMTMCPCPPAAGSTNSAAPAPPSACWRSRPSSLCSHLIGARTLFPRTASWALRAVGMWAELRCGQENSPPHHRTWHGSPVRGRGGRGGEGRGGEGRTNWLQCCILNLKCFKGGKTEVLRIKGGGASLESNCSQWSMQY